MADKAVGLSNLAGVKAWANETFSKPGDAVAVKGTIVLSSTGWSGEGPFTQSVIISEATVNSQINLQPDSTVIDQLITDGVTALWIENNNGTLTAYAMGAAPTVSLEVQYTRLEVTT